MLRVLLGCPVLIGTGRKRRRLRTPHAGQVERASSSRTVGRGPPARDLDIRVRTRFDPSRLGWRRACPRRPASASDNHWIERTDYSRDRCPMDYLCEPPSSWASHSHGNPALRARRDAGGSVRPLHLVGGQAQSASPHVGHAEHALTLIDDRRAEPRGAGYGVLARPRAISQREPSSSILFLEGGDVRSNEAGSVLSNLLDEHGLHTG